MAVMMILIQPAQPKPSQPGQVVFLLMAAIKAAESRVKLDLDRLAILISARCCAVFGLFALISHKSRFAKMKTRNPQMQM